MRRLVFLAISILFAAQGLLAGEADDLQKQLNELRKQREDIETSYLQDKYAFIDEKQKARDELAVLESKARELLERRNLIKEDIQNLKRDRAEAEDRNNSTELRITEIYGSYISLADKLKAFVRMHVPLTSDIDYQKISALRDDAEKKKNLQTTGTDIIDFMFDLLGKSQTSEVFYDDILDDKGALHKGTKIRIGGVFYGYVTDDNSQSGILLRTSVGDYKWNTEAVSPSLFKSFVNGFKGKDVFGHLPLDVMQSYSTAKAVGGGTTVFSGFFAWFRSGGIVMYAILAVMIIAFYIIIERMRAFRSGRLTGRAVLEPVLENIKAGKNREAAALCKENACPQARLLGTIIESPAKTDEQGYDLMQSVMLEEIPQVEKRLSTLKSLGALAPLLGLLGTVTGMISLFDVITAVGTGDPKLLAGGISEALVTTEFGLIVAIPAVLAYRLLQNKADAIISDLERSGLLVLNQLKQAKQSKK